MYPFINFAVPHHYTILLEYNYTYNNYLLIGRHVHLYILYIIYIAVES